jgi:rhamnosyltransferase
VNRVAAIVVTYNPEIELIQEELSALRPQVDSLIIIDNASEFQLLRSLKDILTPADFIVVNESNRGIAAALNQGVEKAISIGARYVLLMDQDSVPDKGLVDTLKQEFEELSLNCKIAAIGPVIVDCYTMNQLPALQYHYFFRESMLVPPDDTILCDQLISSGTFLSIESFNSIGEFDESLFIDFVDIEWGLRAKLKGYSCAMTSKKKLKHHLGDGTKRFWLGRWREFSLHSPLREYYIARNPWLLLRKKDLPLGYRAGEILHSIVRLFLAPMLAEQKMDTFISCLRGTYDGVLNRRSL